MQLTARVRGDPDPSRMVIMFRRTLPLILPLIAAGCATTTTQFADVDPALVAAEERAQREIVLRELDGQQARLDDLSFELLEAAVPLCGEDVAPRYGVRFANIYSYEEDWRAEAASALGLGDTIQILSVSLGSPAASAGLRAGDRVLAVENETLLQGDQAAEDLGRRLELSAGNDITLEIERDGSISQVLMLARPVCDFAAVVTVEGDINAFADGERMIFPWAMMRFAEDDELRGVLGHEIAHNAMGHIDARKKNALTGGILGAILDVAAATQGVNTAGQNTANFMSAAAQAFSQDFEREADYVGMYILARAGKDLESVPHFWREFAQVNPSAISYASTHPTTAERFVRLRQIADEIDTKVQAGEPLLPNMKEGEQLEPNRRR